MIYKTEPFAHQRKNVEEHWDDLAHALFHEQGVGKSKTVIDHAARLYEAGKIDSLIIIAPNSVHENWITDELPAHCPLDWVSHAWYSKKASTKWHARAAAELLDDPRFAVLAMSYSAFMTAPGRKFIMKFAKIRRPMCVLDESQRIKTPSAKRTFALVAFGRRFKYKRILSGTPGDKPFDYYPQLRFLDEHFWVRHGFAQFEPFKTYFGIVDVAATRPGARFPVYSNKKFRNLEQLREMVATISSRVLKADVLDLPPKVYTKRYYDLSPEQDRLYKQMTNEFRVELDTGDVISAPLVITRMLRWQQIICGYLPSEEVVYQGGRWTPTHFIRLKENPRLALLKDTLEDVEGKALIFARFTQDIDQICESLGKDCVRYDGTVDDGARLKARRSFQDPDGARFFVGNPAACGLGLTLTAGATVIYYSNSFSYEDRIQSEDRAHRISQTRTVRYIDLAAKNTIDGKLISALRGKFDVASQITGDKLRSWI